MWRSAHPMRSSAHGSLTVREGSADAGPAGGASPLGQIGDLVPLGAAPGPDLATAAPRRRDPFAPLLENPLAALFAGRPGRRGHPRCRPAAPRAGHGLRRRPRADQPRHQQLPRPGRRPAGVEARPPTRSGGTARARPAAACSTAPPGCTWRSRRSSPTTTAPRPPCSPPPGSTPTWRCCPPSAGPEDVLLVDAHVARQPARRRRGQPGDGRCGSGTTSSTRSRSGWRGLDPRAGVGRGRRRRLLDDRGAGAAGRARRPVRRRGRAAGRRRGPRPGRARRGAAGERSSRAGVLDRVDAVTVAFSKSLASVGGAMMTSRAAADGIRASAMPYVFSAANDPASVGAALAALRHPAQRARAGARLQRQLRAAAPRADRERGAAAAGRRRGHRRPDRRRGGDRPAWRPPSTPASTPTRSPTRRCRGAAACCG